MAMNRQQKRMLQKQGQLGADGAPAARKRPAPQAPRPAAKDERTGPIQFLREVRGELRKVAWPTRAEVINYSIIVLVALLVLMALIFGFDYVFGKAVFFLFDT
jgi:preprotein translocase subunit SecE